MECQILGCKNIIGHGSCRCDFCERHLCTHHAYFYGLHEVCTNCLIESLTHYKQHLSKKEIKNEG